MGYYSKEMLKLPSNYLWRQKKWLIIGLKAGANGIEILFGQIDLTIRHGRHMLSLKPFATDVASDVGLGPSPWSGPRRLIGDVGLRPSPWSESESESDTRDAKVSREQVLKKQVIAPLNTEYQRLKIENSICTTWKFHFFVDVVLM
ncbi:hypothetical protein LXL04_010195 [Taraxacum kok-saghyz]